MMRSANNRLGSPKPSRPRARWTDEAVQHYPLLTHPSPETSVAWRQGRLYSKADFLRQVWALAARLPAQRYVVNLCKDRYHFAVGFAAALVARQISLFPTCRAKESLEALARQYPGAYALIDEGGSQGTLTSLNIHALRLDPSASTDTPLIPADQPAAVVFTSGSSGLPQAHSKQWGALVLGAQALDHQFNLPCSELRMVVGTVPTQHMYGLETTILLPWQKGWAIHAGNSILPADVRDDLHALPHPAWLMTTPVHLKAYVDAQVALPGLEGIISATMPLSRPLAHAAEIAWRVPVYEMYGCTEGGILASRRPTESTSWRLCAALHMRQDDDATWVTGGHVGAGIRLTDRITMQRPHEFTLHGPCFDLVKVGGKRASIAALNAALLNVGGVQDGTFYWPDQGRSGTGRLTAFVVAPDADPAAILCDLRRRIDPVFLPRPLYVVPSLPRNGTGKLPREQLDAFAVATMRAHSHRSS